MASELNVPSAIPSKIPARKCSASSLRNLTSSLAAADLPVESSASDTAKMFLPDSSRKETWVCLCRLSVSYQVSMKRQMYPLHPGSYTIEVELNRIYSDKESTYIAPRLGHESRNDAVLHADALRQELE